MEILKKFICISIGAGDLLSLLLLIESSNSAMVTGLSKFDLVRLSILGKLHSRGAKVLSCKGMFFLMRKDPDKMCVAFVLFSLDC